MSPVTFNSDFNPLPDLERMGFKPTSGYRTQGHQNALLRQGLTKTRNSSHTKGDGLDMVPPQGMSKGAAISRLKTLYPGIKAIPSNGGAIHVTFPGWGNAPDVSGSRKRYGN